MSQREAIDVNDEGVDELEGWKSDLLDEKVISDAYFKSEGIWSSTFNVCVVFISLVISLLIYVWMFHSKVDHFILKMSLWGFLIL